MSNYSAILEPFKGDKSRHTCPSCGKRFEFARYLKRESGEYVADHVGRCNREVNCGYHYTPKQYYEDNKHSIDLQRPADQFKPKPKPAEPVKPVDYLPYELLEKTMKGYEGNHFFTFLKSLFGDTIAMDLIETYYVGTSRHWPGANIFWQVDMKGNLRQAKIMLYNVITGRRIKDQGDKVYFAGKSILKNQEANLQQCFFGEVLLSMNPKKRVAIVESEKTAMIAAVYFPGITWLATGGSHGCRWAQRDVCNVLEGREVILFPDLGFYEKWKAKASQLVELVKCKVVVSDLLEKNATEDQKKASWDLADYLLLNREPSGWAMTTEGYPLIWDLTDQLNEAMA